MSFGPQDWVVEGLKKPGVRGTVFMGKASSGEEAIRLARAGLDDPREFWPLLARPNYILTGKIDPVSIETSEGVVTRP